MSLEDPFFVVKGEVQQAVNTARGLYERWCQLLEETHVVSKEEFDWTTNELRNSLRSIDWDLEDLEETIDILPERHQELPLQAPGELAARRDFVTQMREALKVRGGQASLWAGGGGMSVLGVEDKRLTTAELVTANSRYLEEQQLHQQLIIGQQDEQLELVSGSIRVLKHMSGRVGDELDEQAITGMPGVGIGRQFKK
uniref:Syntaxin 10 n=1 Tax=Sphenodon punctatus TaxID=8508 RepID=A0A8D0L1A9_SPHPU